MLVWQKYFFRRWLKAIELMSTLGLISLVYMVLNRSSIGIGQIEAILIGVNTVLCFILGMVEVTFDYPLILQIKAERQCYLKYMGLGILIGGMALLFIEKLTFGLLEGGVLKELVWQQCVYRYSTLVMMAFLGSLVASVFYRFTPMIAICLLGSFIAIGVSSLIWGMLSQNIVIVILCNFYIMLLRGLTSIGGTIVYSLIFAIVVYALLYKAPIKAYKCDLL